MAKLTDDQHSKIFACNSVHGKGLHSDYLHYTEKAEKELGSKSWEDFKREMRSELRTRYGKD
ncbi:hypothetical protein NIES4106_62010 (plasmid) [Fischerella sp. NIES-4106]|nr:hypothetical protein NIES4106_62010 [Fischerella sp. NIES-4106]